MQFSELDVVNDCLSTLGELPVNSLDDDHILISAATRAFRTCLLREQARQWWFNTERVELVTDTSGFIYVPQDAIRVTPIDDCLPLMQRGRRLYDTGTTGNEAGYVLTMPSVVCKVVRMVPFDDLPPSAQVLVGVATQLRFMSAYDADSLRYRQLTTEYQEAFMTLSAEHTRNMKSNLLEKHPTIGRLRRIAGDYNSRMSTPGAYKG